MRFCFNLLIFSVFLLLQASGSSARTLELFRCDHPRRIPGQYYDMIIKTLAPGDVLKFCNEKSFTIKEIAGEGKRTLVLRTEERPDAVLRISLEAKYISLLQQTVDASAEMAKLDLPHPDVLESYWGQYVLTEDMGHDLITMRDWAFEKTLGIPDEELMISLVVFTKKIARIAKVPDSHWKNIAYSPVKKEWFFLDFCDGITCVTGGELLSPDVTIGVRTPLSLSFEQIRKDVEISIDRKKTFRNYEAKIASVLLSERKRLFFKDVWSTCNRVLKGLMPSAAVSPPSRSTLEAVHE